MDIVRWLCEHGGAASVNNSGVRGVDVQSKGGWTPLSKFLLYSYLIFPSSELD